VRQGPRASASSHGPPSPNFGESGVSVTISVPSTPRSSACVARQIVCSSVGSVFPTFSPSIALMSEFFPPTGPKDHHVESSTRAIPAQRV